ncbi:MAG: cobalt ECF transporter T component CbiQ [Gemmataceae bacterium]
MTLTFDHPDLVESWWRRLDARWKLTAVLLAVGAAATLQTVIVAAVSCVLALTLAVLARLPRRWFGLRLGVVAVGLAPFVLLLPFVLGKEPAWPLLGPIRFSLPGLWTALLLVCKAMTITTLVLALLVSVPLPTLFQAAQSLRIPGLLVQLALLTYRYIFVLADELRRLRLAMRLRGFRNRPNRHSYRTLGNVAGTLLVRSSERAERVGQAMRCRGYDGRFRALTDFRTTIADILSFLIMAGVAAGLLIADGLLSLH